MSLGLASWDISGRWLRRRSQFGVRLNISAIPVFDGVIELIAGGTASSLQESR